MRTVYLDHAASTPLREEVYETMLPYLRGSYGNPSSIYRIGREAYVALERARGEVGTALDVTPNELVFTGSGTEANNFALVGVARARKESGMHLLVSQVEHPSVLAAADRLREDGFEVEYIPVNYTGRIDVDRTLARVRKDTILVSVMYANNELGTVEPIGELAASLTRVFGSARPLLHTDACQAPGQLPVSPRSLGVDLMTLNGAKVYGPRGVGLLYVREGVRLEPYLLGGHQELGRRAGTENVAGIVGFARALVLAVEEQVDASTKLTELRDRFIRELEVRFPDVVVNGHRTERLPGNVHVSFPHIEGEALTLLLDERGISVATGSACNSMNLLPSHVLRAIGQSSELIHGSIRLTLGRETTWDDLTYTLDALTEAVNQLRAISPLPLRL